MVEAGHANRADEALLVQRDWRADGGSRRVRVTRAGVLITRRFGGVDMRIAVPAPAYRGVALDVAGGGDGAPCYRLSLVHRDRDLDVRGCRRNRRRRAAGAGSAPRRLRPAPPAAAVPGPPQDRRHPPARRDLRRRAGDHRARLEKPGVSTPVRALAPVCAVFTFAVSGTIARQAFSPSSRRKRSSHRDGRAPRADSPRFAREWALAAGRERAGACRPPDQSVNKRSCCRASSGAAARGRSQSRPVRRNAPCTSRRANPASRRRRPPGSPRESPRATASWSPVPCAN